MVVNGSDGCGSLSLMVVDYIRGLPGVCGVYPQYEVDVVVEGVYPCNVTLRAVEDVEGFLRFLCPGAFVLGRVDSNGILVGYVLADVLNVSLGDTLTVVVNGEPVKLPVVGIVKCYRQLDAELLMSIELARDVGLNLNVTSIMLSAEDGFDESLIEEAYSGVEVFKVRDVPVFLESVGDQLSAIVDFWSMAIYVSLALSAYVVAAKLSSSLRYEVEVLRAIGGKRARIVVIVILCFFIASIASSIVGVSLGLVASQSAITIMEWAGRVFASYPHIDVLQAMHVIAFSSMFFTLGCIPPVLIALRRFEVL
ncbi:MAG: ABC transporter permease [Candidatus Nezhaarchaeales archaeon]